MEDKKPATNFEAIKDIKEKVLKNIYTLIHKTNRSNAVWKTFRHIQTDANVILDGYAACRDCLEICEYQYTKFWKLGQHKCHQQRIEFQAKSLERERLNKRRSTINPCPDYDTLPITAKLSLPSPTKKERKDEPTSTVTDSDSRITDTDTDQKIQIEENVFGEENLLFQLNNGTDRKRKVNKYEDIKKGLSTRCCQFIVNECVQPDLIYSDGFKELLLYFIRLGAQYGSNVDVNTLLPKRLEILDQINKTNETILTQLADDIRMNTEYGAAVSIVAYPGHNFITLNIHFIKENHIKNQFIGFIDYETTICAKDDIRTKVYQRLRSFGLSNTENVLFIVPSSDDTLSKIFGRAQLNCSYELMRQLLTDACRKSLDVHSIIEECKNLHLYLMKDEARDKFKYTPGGTDFEFSVINVINENWNTVNAVLLEKDMADTILLKKEQLEALVPLLAHFQKALNEMKSQKSATVHLVYMQIHILKKRCLPRDDDCDLIKKLKETLLDNIQNIWIAKLSNYHKMALFLFPPTNALLMFDEEERNAIKNRCCKEIIDFDNKTLIQMVTPFDVDAIVDDADRSEYLDMLSDILRVSHNNIASFHAAIDQEFDRYSRMFVPFTANFDVLQWWYFKRNELPLLNALCMKILAIPATIIPYNDSIDKLIKLKFNFFGDVNNYNNILFINSIQNQD